MKTDIDVMMFFKFEFKYVKLIFKAIASIEFSFEIRDNSFMTLEDYTFNFLHGC